MKKIFYTVRETAATGILPEYALRILLKQGKIPHIMCGKKAMINYPLLLKALDEESKRYMKDEERADIMQTLFEVRG